MPFSLLLAWLLTGAPPPSAPAPGPAYAKPLPEGVHAAGEYYAARSGTTWRYAAGKERPSVSVTSVENWLAHVSISWGKRSTGGAWRVKDGAWLERLGVRGGAETVLLPAQLQVGTRWKGPSSLERNGKDESTYEVLATDATVQLPEQSYEKCLAVLETADGGGEALTHFWAPNVGKVAVKGGGDDWLLRLVEYRPGRHVNGD